MDRKVPPGCEFACQIWWVKTAEEAIEVAKLFLMKPHDLVAFLGHWEGCKSDKNRQWREDGFRVYRRKGKQQQERIRRSALDDPVRQERVKQLSELASQRKPLKLSRTEC